MHFFAWLFHPFEEHLAYHLQDDTIKSPELFEGIESDGASDFVSDGASDFVSGGAEIDWSVNSVLSLASEDPEVLVDCASEVAVEAAGTGLDWGLLGLLAGALLSLAWGGWLLRSGEDGQNESRTDNS